MMKKVTIVFKDTDWLRAFTYVYEGPYIDYTDGIDTAYCFLDVEIIPAVEAAYYCTVTIDD